MSKTINYLSVENVEIWVLILGYFPWDDRIGEEPVRWVVFKKDKNWKSLYDELKRKERENIKKVASPIDFHQ